MPLWCTCGSLKPQHASWQSVTRGSALCSRERHAGDRWGSAAMGRQQAGGGRWGSQAVPAAYSPHTLRGLYPVFTAGQAGQDHLVRCAHQLTPEANPSGVFLYTCASVTINSNNNSNMNSNNQCNTIITYYYGCYKDNNTTIIREKLLKLLYPRYPPPRNDSPFSFCQGIKNSLCYKNNIREILENA